MTGIVILGIALFILSVDTVMLYVCLVTASPVKKIAARTVLREKIPADWDRIMRDTVIERRKARK
jgi:hypothetical protein